MLGALRDAYAGAATMVVGSGHSAMNVVLDLLALRKQAPGTRVLWALRRNRMARLLGGGLNDQLPARGALGLAATQAIQEGRLELLSPYAAERVERTADGLRITGRLDRQPHAVEVQRVVVATGLRPDLSILRELRVELDPQVEALLPETGVCSTDFPAEAEEASCGTPAPAPIPAKGCCGTTA